MMLLLRSAIGAMFNLVIYGLLLFLPAGTWRWERAWILLGVIVVCTLGTMLLVFRNNEELLRERMKPPIQKGQPLADKVILLAFLASYIAAIVAIPRDVFFHHWLPAPPGPVAAGGLVLVVLGWLMISLTFRENAFAAPVVKHQKERQHKVIDTGVYAHVRHPMYAGALLLMVGMPLWLGSTAATLFAAGPIALLAVRIIYEEKFLRANLPGYGEYTRRVQARLVPGVW